MEFRILGPLEVLDGDRSLPLGGAQQRAVLAVLLLEANRVVSADRLIDALWGEEAPGTARNVLQGYISHLRKTLGADVIVTRPPGYAVAVGADELDLHRFERLLSEAREALGADTPEPGAAKLREALELWRGPALADFAYEGFAQAATARLEELRLTALEDRIEADLSLGRHGAIVGELEALLAAHPLRERLRAQLMLALYRSGRQAEALECFRTGRRVLVDELGIDPSPALQELERAILRQDPGLSLSPAGVAEPTPTSAGDELQRSILVVAGDETGLDALLTLAEPLARRPARELVLTILVAKDQELPDASALLRARRAGLIEGGAAVRAASFTSTQPGEDAARLASRETVDLLLFDGTAEIMGSDKPGADLEAVLAAAPCDVAVLVAGEGRTAELGSGRPVLVPFGGAEHEWAAAEIGAWLAGAVDAPLKLVGTAADQESGRRDASRLLATASLIVQQVGGVPAEPLLVEPGAEPMVAAAGDAALLVIGLSDRWRQEGVGEPRLTVAREARPPCLLVRGGLRPGGLAPRASLTRYTWSLATR